jgi:putative spermidine/putrescine transport system permease protein
LIVTVSAAIFLTLPILMTVATALTKNAFKGLSSGLTLKWTAQVLDTYGDTVVRSLILAGAVLLVTIAAGVPMAYALVKLGRNRLAGLLEELLVLPLSIPGLSIGLGILLCWGSFGRFRLSPAFILCGHVIYCLPFMTLAVASVLRVNPIGDLEEAARTLGAGFWSRFFAIVVPAAAPGIVSGALQVLTLSIGEFNISWLLQTPFTRTLPVGLADSYASMRLEIGAAYTLILLVVITPLSLLTRKTPAILEALSKMGRARQERSPHDASPIPARL